MQWTITHVNTTTPSNPINKFVGWSLVIPQIKQRTICKANNVFWPVQTRCIKIENRWKQYVQADSACVRREEWYESNWVQVFVLVCWYEHVSLVPVHNRWHDTIPDHWRVRGIRFSKPTNLPQDPYPITEEKVNEILQLHLFHRLTVQERTLRTLLV